LRHDLRIGGLASGMDSQRQRAFPKRRPYRR
jgi:hypothetical protein